MFSKALPRASRAFSQGARRMHSQARVAPRVGATGALAVAAVGTAMVMNSRSEAKAEGSSPVAALAAGAVVGKTGGGAARRTGIWCASTADGEGEGGATGLW